MNRPQIDLFTWATELEQDDAQTTITELGEFLEACGYRRLDCPEQWQRVYWHREWHPWTFDISDPYVPKGYLKKIVAYVRGELT